MGAKLVQLLVVEQQSPAARHSPQEVPIGQPHVVPLKEELQNIKNKEWEAQWLSLYCCSTKVVRWCAIFKCILVLKLISNF